MWTHTHTCVLNIYWIKMSFDKREVWKESAKSKNEHTKWLILRYVLCVMDASMCASNSRSCLLHERWTHSIRSSKQMQKAISFYWIFFSHSDLGPHKLFDLFHDAHNFHDMKFILTLVAISKAACVNWLVAMNDMNAQMVQ